MASYRLSMGGIAAGFGFWWLCCVWSPGVARLCCIVAAHCARGNLATGQENQDLKSIYESVYSEDLDYVKQLLAIISYSVK